MTSRSSLKSKSNKRLRSRNKIIDDWLDDGNDEVGSGYGSDNFADLEDFLVP
jgi:hypothetical protein